MNQSLIPDIAEALHDVEICGLLSATCTIKMRPGESTTPTVDSEGWVDQDPADYTPRDGCSNIACMFAVTRPSFPELAAMIRANESIDTKGDRQILLDGYFPQIQQRDLAFVTFANGNPELEADGPFQILAVEHDSQATITRLGVRYYRQ